MKIFFCGALTRRWMSGWQRCQTLRELGYEVVEFRQDGYQPSSRLLARLVHRLTGKVFDTGLVERFNRDFLAAIGSARPDVAWIEKALLLRADTLAQAKRLHPACEFICFQDDDPFGLRTDERPFWKYFIESIPRYDLHFIKKECEVAEFRQHGASDVRLFTSGFYEGIFHPVEPEAISDRFKRDVSFVGTPHDHRVGVIGELLRRHRLPVQVHGNSWGRTLIFYTHRRFFHPAAVEEEYVNVICGSKICLGFVSSSNRDQYTMRTFEIPACKGFLLAERTEKHLEFFTEGKEAEYFGSTDECADKIRFYLKHEAVRLRIAEAGYGRCLESDYSLRRRLAEAMNYVEWHRKH